MSGRGLGACLALAGLAAIAAGPPQAAPERYPFQDPDLPLERRVDDILSRMTLDEKVECLGTNPSVPRLGIKGTGHVEGLHGLAMGGPGGWGRPKVVPTTTFPQAVGLGETWDAELLRRVGAAEGLEVRYMYQSPRYAQGGLVVRAPNADLARDVRWGRTEESFGEDAHLAGALSVAFIKGLQGDHPRYWQAASLLKHFLANSHEVGRISTSSDFDERQLREYYSVPFRMGIVQGGARAYMAAYNAHHGVPMTVHPMLQDMTVREWGQDGIICTDAGALGFLVTGHKSHPDLPRAAAASVRAGINQFLDKQRGAVKTAVEQGLLAEKEIDAVLRGNFRVMIRLGLLDPPERVPWSRIGEGPEPWLSEEHRTLARLATRKSVVLLKNEKGLLPLDRGALRSLAVVGPRADDVLLDWYSGTPPYTVSVLAGIRAKVGPGTTVRHAGADEEAAVAAARASEVALVVVGNHPTCDAGWEQCPVPSDGKEAVDRRAVALEQEALVRRIREANPRTVVVLVSSFPFAIPWTQENVPAIVHLAHNSQEQGHGLADVLFGDYNPAGRLVHTWPRSLDQLPPIMDYDLRHGRTYQYFAGEPLYPFGHGLSYTRFAYSRLEAAGPAAGADALTVRLALRNEGTRDGEEVVQLYLSHPGSAVPRPRRELEAFRRVSVSAGATETVELRVPLTALAYWDTARRRFVVEKGRVDVEVGSSSADIRLRGSVTIARESSFAPSLDGSR